MVYFVSLGRRQHAQAGITMQRTYPILIDNVGDFSDRVGDVVVLATDRAVLDLLANLEQ
jgi:hypothetical protein